MNNDGNAHYFTQSERSFNPIKNNKKLHVGILLNSYSLETWDYAMLEGIIRSGYASLDLVIVNGSREEKTSYLDKILANRKKLLYIAYTKLENQIIQCHPDAFAPTDAQKLLENIPVIETKPKKVTYFDWIEQEDVEKIKEYRLDVIIRLGFRILKGDILNAAQYGVWSYHHDDNTIIRGVPPGFWETFENRGERGVILQRLTEDLDNGIVLYRSTFPCDSLVVKRNNNDCYLRSSLFVPRTLKRLYCNGETAFSDTIETEQKGMNFYNDILYVTPTNFNFFTMFIRQSSHMAARYINRTFFQRQWLLMYDLRDQISTSFYRFRKILPPKDRFWADPHVFFKDDTYFIFIEEYLYGKKKGHISLIEMQQSGKYSGPVTVLEEPFHLSYPHIFDHNGTLYMIPETQQADSINLYECTVFPHTWKHSATLLDSVDAVDPTLLFHNNTWWLFANIAEPKGTSINNELYLFYSHNLFSHDWKSHPMNPLISDVRKARPAGKIIERNGTLYRPSQCGSPWYGYGIKINEIVELTKNDYQEKEIAFIEPKWDKKLNGVHTFCHENRLTMIDGDYTKFVV
jgi:hypothetical protein